MHVKNMVKDLTEEQKNIRLKANPDRKTIIQHEIVGKTLGEFIENEMWDFDNPSLTDLMEQLEMFGIEWPFRKLYVTVEVKATRDFTLAVLDDDTMAAFTNGKILLDEIDPGWTHESAEETAVDDISTGVIECDYDYAVDDDQCRRIVDWN